MKNALILLAIAIGGCTTAAPRALEKSDFCIYLDNRTGFARCESAEIVCYVSNGAQSCYPKPAPSPTPEKKK